MKYKQLVVGVLLGSMVTSAGAVVASESTAITAFLKNEVIFKLNGVEKKLDNGYSVLTYKNSTYVPARFIAEELGAKVVWDNKTQSILIDSPNASKEESVKPDVPKSDVSKPDTQASDWDKFDGEWSGTDLTVKLDFVSAVKANVELKFPANTELDGMKFTVDFSESGYGKGEASVNGQTYSITLVPNSGGSLLATILNTTTKHVYTANLTGKSPLPVAANSSGSDNQSVGNFTGNVKDYQGKWKTGKHSLTLAFEGNTAKLVFDNEDSTGFPDFSADVKLLGEGVGSTEITKDGSKYLVQLSMGNKQVNLTVINVTNGQVYTEVFSSKE